MVRTIVNNFVTERNANEVVAVGINAVREICNRAPLTMTDDLLGDLAAYKNSKVRVVGTSGPAEKKTGSGISNPVSGSPFSLPETKQELTGFGNLTIFRF